MKTVQDRARDIVVREGGLTDNASDEGGITNHGVSLVYARGVGLRMDLNHDGVVDGEDIKLVTVQEAVDLFVEDFYDKPGFDKLDIHVATFCFDAAVNHGPFFATQFAQRAAIRVGTLQQFDKGRPQDDGVLGPKSDAAINAATAQRGWSGILTILADERKEFMRDIARRDTSQQQFLAGWLSRVDQLCVDIFHEK